MTGQDHRAGRISVPEELQQRMVALRRDLHRHPELGGREERTSERIASELRALGLDVRTGVAGHGVVADIPGKGDGLIALRADMDALSIQEVTGLPFASENPGVMHACGHDGHCAMLVGAAELLIKDAGARPAGGVRLIFQPAEEKGTGARAMIEAGVLDGVRQIFGLHIDRLHPPGTFAIQPGTVNASTDRFVIEISGRAAHGARPHESLDAVVAGSTLVSALQTIVSREVDPAEPSVISVGRFEAGTSHNIIAGHATLEGTVRAHSSETRGRLQAALDRVTRSVAELHGAVIRLTLDAGTPPVINTPEMAALARRAALRTVTEDRIGPMSVTNMGGEDFAWYLERIPGAYIRVGGGLPGGSAPAHSPRYDFDEAALASGAAWMVAMVHEATAPGSADAAGAGRK